MEKDKLSRILKSSSGKISEKRLRLHGFILSASSGNVTFYFKNGSSVNGENILIINVLANDSKCFVFPEAINFHAGLYIYGNATFTSANIFYEEY